MAKKQIINPYLRFAKGATGPYANRISGSAHAKTFNIGACFRIVSAQIGDPWPDQVYITYSDNFNDTTCSVGTDWDFQYSGETFEFITPLAPVSSRVDAWSTVASNFQSGASPGDNVTLSYTPGTCAKDGDAECALDQLTNFPISNRILGPSSLEIGDVADNIVVVDYPVDMTAEGVAGTWTVENGEGPSVVSVSLVGGNIHIELAADVFENNRYFVNHVPPTTAQGAQGSDGRYSYRFYGLEATNNVDITAPSVPTGLVATATGTQTINLTWNASTDNKSGVKGYNIFRNDGGFEYRFVDDRIDLPIPSLTGTSPGRIEVTVRPDDFRGADNQVIFEGNGDTWLRCFYFAQDETYRFRAFSNDNTISSYDIDVQSPNEVTHICRWKANSGGSTYEVGGETNNGISGVSSPHTTLYIGRRENGLAPFKGVIKEVKYYDAEFGGNLVHYWKINDNSSTIADSVGAADGTLQAGGSGSWQGGYIDFVEHPTTTYDDTGLTEETTYTYTVSAVDNRNNESAQSASDNATTFAPAPNVTAAEVGNVADNIVVVTFDREVVAANYTTGWSFTENGSPVTIQSSAKTQATEVQFTLTNDIAEGSTAAYNYNASAGNYENTDGVAMENQSGSVTNNVTAGPDFEAFAVDDNGKILTLKTGTGSVTFERQTEATIVDHEGLVKTVPAHCLRPENGRIVENRQEANSVGREAYFSSEADSTISDATIEGRDCLKIVWDIGPSGGGTIVNARTQTRFRTPVGSAVAQTCYMYLSRALTGSEEIWYYEHNAGNSNRVTLDASNSAQFVGAWVRVMIPVYNATAEQKRHTFRIGSGKPLTSALDCYVTDFQGEDISGQSGQVCGEHVPVGVGTGSELQANDYSTDTGNWTPYGTNTVENDGGAVKVTYVDNADGAYVYLSRDGVGPQDGDLSENLVLNKTYVIEVDARVGAGDSVQLFIGGGPDVSVGFVTETAFETFTATFVATSETHTYLRTQAMSAGEEVWVRNISVREADHGLFVDGVRAYAKTNPCQVDGNNVVTEDAATTPLTDWRFLFEPAATNYADGADDLSGGAETVDLTTAGTGDYTLSVEGTAAVTVAAGTATGTGFGQATEGNPVTFNLTGAGTVTLTLDSGTLDKVDGLAIKQIEKNPFATSWIPTDGATANRTADDASGMFEEANFSQTEGSWIARLNGIARPTDGQHAIFNLTAASTQGPLYRVNNDLRANDGTDESSVTFAAGDDGDDVYVAVDFGTGSTKEVGYRNITDTGSWTWDGTPTNYDGGFPTDAAGINILNGQTEPVRIRDFHGFTTRVGKTNIEGIY